MSNTEKTRSVIYRTKATIYEEFRMQVPESVIAQGDKAIRKYVWKHDMEDGEFIETVDKTDRKLDKDESAIEIEEDE